VVARGGRLHPALDGRSGGRRDAVAVYGQVVLGLLPQLGALPVAWPLAGGPKNGERIFKHPVRLTTEACLAPFEATTRCGVATVPANWAKPDGRTLQVWYASRAGGGDGRCAQEVGPRRDDYTKVGSVLDIEAIRRALHLPNPSLLGPSYGTWVVQTYTVLFPKLVQAAVIDGIVPFDLDPWGRTYTDAMQRVLRLRCQRTTLCDPAEADARVRRVAASLAAQPVPFPNSTQLLTEGVFSAVGIFAIQHTFADYLTAIDRAGRRPSGRGTSLVVRNVAALKPQLTGLCNTLVIVNGQRPGAVGWRPQPQRHAGRLHGLVDHGEQLGREGVKVDRLAQPGAQRRDGPGGVVAAPIEAPVHRLLDAAAGRLEQRGSRHPGPPAPARGGQRAGRGEHQHEAATGQQGASIKAVGDPSQVAGSRQRPRPGHHPVVGVLGNEGVGRRQQPDAEQQPAHRVRWAAAGQHRSDRGGAHRRHQQRGAAGLHHAQLWPAALAQQVVQPGGNGQAEHGQRPQRARRHARPPAPRHRDSLRVHPSHQLQPSTRR
jgi:hypothetical protein